MQNKNITIIIILILTITIGILYSKNIHKNDFFINIGNQFVNDNMTEMEKVIILMNYSHQGFGHCSDKSWRFEQFAKGQGIKVEHIVLTNGTYHSHAISRVKIDGKWIYVDSLTNNIREQEYFYNEFTKITRWINCIDAQCSNYNKIEILFKLFTYHKTIYYNED